MTCRRIEIFEMAQKGCRWNPKALCDFTLLCACFDLSEVFFSTNSIDLSDFLDNQSLNFPGAYYQTQS